MKNWSFGANSLPQWRLGSISLEEAPWYVFAAEATACFVCEHIPAIPLPPLPIVRDGEKTTLAEWYGDTRDLFHFFVHDPVFQWANRNTKTIDVSLGYYKIREIFGEEHKEYFEYEESIAKGDKEEE